MKKRVFITRNILPDGQRLLEDNGYSVEVFSEDRPMTPVELMSRSRDFDALITMLGDNIDKHFLEANSHLKVIANYAVGFNNIDLATAKRLNIRIANTPDVLSEATAEIAMGLLLAATRRFQWAHSDAYEGRWKTWGPRDYLGYTLRGKTLGVIGMGRIGLRFAEMAHHAFHMKVIYVANSDKQNSLNAKRVSLDELLRTSDFISIHTPLTSETKHLINKEAFLKMKPNAVLVNTSRGQVIDQEALIWALKENKIFAAGLDVTDPEPLPKEHELFHLENVFILPHIGSATFEARTEMSILCAKNVMAGLEGQKLVTEVL